MDSSLIPAHPTTPPQSVGASMTSPKTSSLAPAPATLPQSQPLTNAIPTKPTSNVFSTVQIFSQKPNNSIIEPQSPPPPSGMMQKNVQSQKSVTSSLSACYVSPSDAIMSPATRKLAAFRQRHFQRPMRSSGLTRSSIRASSFASNNRSSQKDVNCDINPFFDSNRTASGSSLS